MAGKKRLLKLGAVVGFLGLLLCLIIGWQLPAVLNLLISLQLDKRGYTNSYILVTAADHKQLTVETGELSSQGWSVSLADARLTYSLPALVQEKEIQTVEIDSLTLSVNTTELPAGDEPLTLQILDGIPIQEVRVGTGLLRLTVANAHFQIHWSGLLTVENDRLLTLTLSELEITAESPTGHTLIHLPRIQHDRLLEIELQPDGSSGAIRWQLPSTNVSTDLWQITEGSSSGDLHFEGTELGNVPLTDTQHLITELSKATDGTVKATLNEFVFGTHSAQWISSDLEINPDRAAAGFRTDLSLNAGIVTTGGQSLEQVSVQLGNRGTLERLDTEGRLTGLFEGIEGQVAFSHTVSNLLEDLSLSGEYTLSPLQFEYSDLPGRYIPGFEDMLFTGNTSADGTYEVSSGATDATARLRLSEGSITVPANNLELSGIEATLGIASIMQLRSEPGNSKITVDLIELGDLTFEDTQFLFDVLDSKTFRLTSGSTGLFDGQLALSPGTFVLNPMEIETSIAFEQLSLKAIVDGMDLFDGTMEGAISGHLPIRFKNGRFESSAGYLELSEGIPARLLYNTDGMFEPEEKEDRGFLGSIGDTIMEKLKLAPENVVEDALSDLTINELRIDVFPENSPGTPARIRLAGEGTTGNTTVPMILDTNINGTTDELLQFLLRIHSLGTPSF